MVHKVAAIAAVLLCATAMTADAVAQGNACLNQANTGLEVLSSRILEARKDNLDAINLLSRNNDPEGIGCLNEVSNQLVELGYRLDSISMLVQLQNSMQTANDRAVVRDYLSDAIDYAVKAWLAMRGKFAMIDLGVHCVPQSMTMRPSPR